MDAQDNGATLKVAESQNHQATPVKTTLKTMLKTPRRLKVNIEKDILEDLPNNCERSVTVIDAETSNKLKTKVLPQMNYNEDLLDESSSEPEIKKKRKGRPSSTQGRPSDKVTVPVKQRSSNRSTKGKLSKDLCTIDIFADAEDTAISSPANVTKRKTAAAGLIKSTGTLPSAPSAHKVKDKTVVNVPKPSETPATNGTALSLKRPSTVTPGTARKRVGGEGRTASLQRILLELPNLCDPNVFPDVLLKTYGSRLEASKVFECLAASDLKEAVMKKFSAAELMTMIEMSNSAAGKLLTMTSTEAILQEVLSREELKKSDALLNFLLQNVDGKMLNETKKALDNEKVIGTVLQVASDDAIVKELNARSSLKSSEKLINTLLQNLPEKISDETKKSVIKVLNEKFNTGELVDISHAAIKMSVDKYQKQ